MSRKSHAVREIDVQLHKACTALSPEKIREAFLAGADANALDETRLYAPIDLIVNELPCRDDYFGDPQFQASVEQCLRLLLDAGASPDGAKCAGLTPLATFAWLYPEPHFCSLLARSGADVNWHDKSRSILDLVGNEISFVTNADDAPDILARLERIYETLTRRGAVHMET